MATYRVNYTIRIRDFLAVYRWRRFSKTDLAKALGTTRTSAAFKRTL